MVSQQIDRQIAARLAASGIRYTSGRRRVVGVLAAADGPRSAAELHDDLGRKVPLSSLYRSLSVLTDAGVLAPHHGSGRIVRYELAEWLMGHHHHLVCADCGAVDDVELPEPWESALAVLVSEATAPQGFIAASHTLEIGGLCPGCLNPEQGTRSKGAGIG